MASIFKLFFAREITTATYIRKLRTMVHIVILCSARHSIMTRRSERMSKEATGHRNVHCALGYIDVTNPPTVTRSIEYISITGNDIYKYTCIPLYMFLANIFLECLHYST